MDIKHVYLQFYLRLGLQILALEAGYLAFSWLLNRYWSVLQRFSFADVLFFMGALASSIGAAGMLRNPYGVPLGPWGVHAGSVSSDEEEKRVILIDEWLHQANFGLRLLAIGGITILLSIALTYI